MPDIGDPVRMLGAIERLQGLLVEPQAFASWMWHVEAVARGRAPVEPQELASWHDAVRQAMEVVAREMPPSVLTAALEHRGNPRAKVLTALLDRAWQEMLRGHIVSFAVHSGTLVPRAWVEERPGPGFSVLCVRVEQFEPKQFTADMKRLDVHLLPPGKPLPDHLRNVGWVGAMPIAVPREFVREPS